jgi:uncharacterized membrane protein YcaP (DUF421 family)
MRFFPIAWRAGAVIMVNGKNKRIGVEVMELFQQLIGTDSDALAWYQAVLRSLIVYIAALAMVRIGEKRFMGKNTAFDVILGVILGSVVSRAINSNDTILPTLLAGFVLVGLHWLMSVITFHSDSLGDLFKGSTRQLVNQGEILWDAMEKSHISRKDLMGQVRAAGSTEDLRSIEKAILERSGTISVIPASGEPKVLEVQVEAGVQTIRIVLEG